MTRLVFIPIIILLVACQPKDAKKATTQLENGTTASKKTAKPLQAGDPLCLSFKEIKYRNNELLIKGINITKQLKNQNCQYSGSLGLKKQKSNVSNAIIPFSDGEFSIWTFWKSSAQDALEYQDYLKPIIDGKGSEITKWDLVTIDHNSYFIYIKYWGDEGSHNKTLYLNKVNKEKRLSVYYKKTVSYDHDSKSKNDIDYTINGHKLLVSETLNSDKLVDNKPVKEIVTKELDLNSYNTNSQE